MKNENGQLLLEVLLAIGVIAILAVLGAQLIFSSKKSNQTAENKDIALGLADQTLNAVQAAAVSDWSSIYNLTKGSNYLYHPIQSSGQWVVASNSENVSVNGVIYTRSFYVQNVGRDSNGNIVLSGGTEDPSTQQIIVSVSWPGGNTVTENGYVTRWRNTACDQSDWSGGTGSQGTCPNTGNFYESQTGLTVGTTLQLAPVQ
jgi:type II secretory pathway pseudopilin PulG